MNRWQIYFLVMAVLNVLTIFFIPPGIDHWTTVPLAIIAAINVFCAYVFKWYE